MIRPADHAPDPSPVPLPDRATIEGACASLCKIARSRGEWDHDGAVICLAVRSLLVDRANHCKGCSRA